LKWKDSLQLAAGRKTGTACSGQKKIKNKGKDKCSRKLVSWSVGKKKQRQKKNQKAEIL